MEKPKGMKRKVNTVIWVFYTPEGVFIQKSNLLQSQKRDILP